MSPTAIYLAIILATTVALPIAADEKSPYVGQEVRTIKSLSPSRIEALLSGKGLGYAKAAELNGYPGPAHVLELSEALSLTEEQLSRTKAIYEKMYKAAKILGAELVTAEAALNDTFQNKTIDQTQLEKKVNAIGTIESQLRATHLSAHLQQTQILTQSQIQMYQSLRGYNRDRHGKQHRQNHNHH